ncbi:MAG TPA: crotonase/enoyl-CoA hydratase family protein [Deltaproteobacteria bacterium]|nr:crotonase/enoyl-CoA hydratase family protein [Deltaproteobacteria bacterium]
MSDDLVRLELRDDVALVTLDDGKANALSPTMIGALQAALERARAEAAAVVLAGRPQRFCAGFDLKIMATGPEAILSLVGSGAELLLELCAFPLPVVGACTGHAIAGGALLLATADHRVGVSGPFKIGLNEVANGMPVPIFAHELARARLDPRELVRATVQAHLYDPEAAVAAGWLDEVVQPEALLPRALAVAGRLATLPASAFARSKASLHQAMITHVRETLADNLATFTQA